MFPQHSTTHIIPASPWKWLSIRSPNDVHKEIPQNYFSIHPAEPAIIWCSPFPKTFFPWHYPFQFFSQQDNHPPLFASDLSHRLPYQYLGLTMTYSTWHQLWRKVWTFHGVISQAWKLNAPSQPTKLAGLQLSLSHLVFSHLIFSLKSL